MPRSHNENENVQFVQELAEVDGPFESPININFRDLTKLELPSLVWNRAECAPKKMKITNTGHTVIISGKWKSERPYLTGGPLLGKYVFSQIHFHWGPDNCKGSEHHVCGETFPLEMHVAHYKADYLSQECALREKDGMVVVVYLFKLQEEPNHGLKKFLNLLPYVKHACTSHSIDPKPITSICNPFSDDYFMYWGSVVTSTCAHILLWIVCREPFGISRDQVGEFRKIWDMSEQPICRNCREPQPLHKRNVFHVNASKNIDEPLLPIKKMMGCYCKGSGENVAHKTGVTCPCDPHMRNQEDIEGIINEFFSDCQSIDVKGEQAVKAQPAPSQTIYVHNTLLYQKPMVELASLPPKKFNSDNIRRINWYSEDLKPSKSDGYSKLTSQSCCFFPMHEINKIKTRQEKRKPRSGLPFNSAKALTNILESLEAVKNQTFKKLREIDTLNEEIKGLELMNHETESKKWIRKIEKMLSKQNQNTMKVSHGYFNELKKLAKECNFDRFFDNKSVGDHNHKYEWFHASEVASKGIPCLDMNNPNEPSKTDQSHMKKVSKFTAKAQQLIQSLFEVIKDNDDFQKNIPKEMMLKKTESLCNKSEESHTSRTNFSKGYITQKMFIMGNLGNRFFTEVSTEDLKINENGWGDKRKSNELVYSVKEEPCEKFDLGDCNRSKIREQLNVISTEETIPLHRANNAIGFSPKQEEIFLLNPDTSLNSDCQIPQIEITSDTETTLNCPYFIQAHNLSHYPKNFKNSQEIPFKKKFDEFVQLSPAQVIDFQSSASDSSLSIGIQKFIIAKLNQKYLQKNIYAKKSSVFSKISSKRQFEKLKNKKHKNFNFEDVVTKRKTLKNQKKKEIKENKISYYDISSTSKETKITHKSKWKKIKKTRFKGKNEKTSESTLESIIEHSGSPVRKKLKLDLKGKENVYSKKRQKPFIKKKKKNQTTESESQTLSTPNILSSAKEPEIVVKVVLPEVVTEKSQEIIEISLPKEENDLKEFVKDSNTHTLKEVFSNSKLSFCEKQDVSLSPPVKKEFVKKEIPKLFVRKLVKNKSLTNLDPKNRLGSNDIQRIFIENIEDRRKSARESFEFRKKIESPKKLEEVSNVIEVNNLSCKKPKDDDQKNDQDENEIVEAGKERVTVEQEEPPIPQEYDVRIIMDTSDSFPEENVTDSQVEERKSIVLNRSETEKYTFLKTELQEVKAPLPEPIKESSKLLKTESDNFKAKEVPVVKSDEIKMDSKDLQTLISCSTNKKNTQSISHSAESLISVKKSIKRKTKKRPHCCKRNSRHFVRKNSSIIRKPNKVENKPVQGANLTEEEQLKIISENVAKYIKQKLRESKYEFDLEKSCSFEEIEEVVLQNLKATEEKIKEITIPEIHPAKEKPKQEPTIIKFSEKKKKEQIKVVTPVEKVKETKPFSESVLEKKASSPRPTHNFIKLNKLLAGKYKRLPPPTDKKEEANFLKKKEESKKNFSKTKNLRKKKEKFLLPKQENESTTVIHSPALTQKPKEKVETEKSFKEKPIVSNKSNSATKTTLKEFEELENPKQHFEIPSKNDLPYAAVTFPTLSPSKKQWIPTFMMTSFSPASVDITEPSSPTLNKYLINMKTPNLPEVFCKARIREKENELVTKDFLFAKDLEYLINLQRTINKEISENLENSMNYMKTILNQEYHGASIMEKQSQNEITDHYESCTKGMVLINVNDILDCSSSSSDDSKRYRFYGDSSKSKHKLKMKAPHMKIHNNVADSEIVKLALLGELDKQEDCSSDSSYNCEISITLSPGSNEGEGEVQITEPFSLLDEFPNSSFNDLPRESSLSQLTTDVNGDNSVHSFVVKPPPKKKMEKEISGEMKQKLLEILEGEIRREMAQTYGLSSETSSDGWTLKRDDSDGMNRSQSTESSCDNLEILAQISETMRQYLTEMKSRNRLSHRMDKVKKKGSKSNDDEFC